MAPTIEPRTTASETDRRNGDRRALVSIVRDPVIMEECVSRTMVCKGTTAKRSRLHLGPTLVGLTGGPDRKAALGVFLLTGHRRWRPILPALWRAERAANAPTTFHFR